MLHQMKSALGALGTKRRHRQDFERLMQLDDHLLRDVGLDRADVLRLRYRYPL